MELTEELILPGGERLPNDPTDEIWDKTFKKYLDYKPGDFCIIKVEDLAREPEDFKNNTGYLKFDMSIDPETGMQKNYIGNIDPNNVNVVPDSRFGTKFTQEEADAFIRGLQQHPDIKSKRAKFIKERASSLEPDQNYAMLILEEYFKVLSKGGNAAITWLKTGESQLFEISKRMNESPLRGNHIFNIAVKIFELYKDGHLSDKFVFDPKHIVLIFNILKHRLLHYTDIINPKNLKGTLVYNPTLYNFNVQDIDKMFRIYDSIKKLSSLDSVKNLEGTIIVDKPSQAAANTILIRGKDDLFKNILFDTVENIKLTKENAIGIFNDRVEKNPLGNAIDDNDYKLINTYVVRDPGQMEEMLVAMGGKLEYSEDDNEMEGYYIQLFPSRETYRGKLSKSEQTAIVKFKNVELEKNSEIRLVIANEFNKTKNTLTNILPTLRNKTYSESFKKLFSIEANKFNCLQDATVDIEAIFSIDSRGKLHLEEFKPTSVSTAHEEKPETKRETTTSGEKRYGQEGTQYTLTQLLKLSNAQFQAIFDNFLSPEEQDEIRDIVKNKADLL